jgi:methylated-DNA-[protein]-cysteine S-methyltransferase
LIIRDSLHGGKSMLAPSRNRRMTRRSATLSEALREPESLALYSFRTQLGWMAVAAKNELICGLTFGHEDAPSAIRAMGRVLPSASAEISPIASGPAEIRDLVERLSAFGQGEEVNFQDVRLSTDHLTQFGEEVTERCREIAWGDTLSYRELAAKCGRPGAARAVGNVMRNNRFPIVVPCHRVLASGGGLGGYSAPQGLTMKQRLLDMEGRS